MKSQDDIYEILKKYIFGESNQKQLQKAIALFLRQDRELEQEIKNILEEAWEQEQFGSPAQSKIIEFSSILGSIHKKIEPKLKEIRRQRTRQIFIGISKIAALLVLGIFMGISFSRLKQTEPVTYTSIAPRGSISQFILPDSTMVYLNSDSRLIYRQNSSGRRREVTLEGEAWFHVSENKKKPFIVHTLAYDVRVIGTKFNVKAYREDNEIVTTLEEGSVIISSTPSFRLKSDLVILPGEQLVYDKEAETLVKNLVDPKYYIAWKDNKLIFINMSLDELVILLERKYGVDIAISDSSILNYHYDGTILNENILEIMDLIKVTLPIDYKVVGQTIEITKN